MWRRINKIWLGSGREAYKENLANRNPRTDIKRDIEERKEGSPKESSGPESSNAVSYTHLIRHGEADSKYLTLLS